MKVFIKYIFKNMTEKKGRFVLLILSIALSTALLVACTGLVDVIKDGFTSQLTEMSEGQDIYVVNNSDNPYFTEQDIDTSNLENIVGRLETVGVISENEKIRYVSISGRKSYDKSIIEGEMNYEDNSASCMISKRIADERDINIGDMADATATSRSGLNRKMKSLLGVTPLDFIREARIRKACQLLKEGLPINDVAYNCGFSDPKYFGKCFKAEIGMTPKEYKVENSPN